MRTLPAVCVAALLLAGCGGPAAPEPGAAASRVAHANATPAATGQLASATWLLSKEPVTLDLDDDAASSQSDVVMANVCERLLQLQPDLTRKPHLAASYEWRTPTTLVLRLRDDVTFHDGSPMTAADVVWSMQRHAAPDAAESDEYVNVTGIAQSGPSEVTVTLSQPDAVFLQAIAGDAGVVWQRAAVEAKGEAFGTPTGSSGDACSGPMTVREWQAGDHIVLAKADNYWNPERASRTDELTVRWAGDEAIVNSLLTGSATGAYLETIASAARLVDGEGAAVSQGDDTRVWSALVTERGGLADPRLRQALSLALDRSGIARAAFAGLSAPAKEPVGPGAWGYERDKFRAASEGLPNLPATPSPADLEKAKQLVAAVSPTQPIVIANDGSSIRNVIAAALVSAAQSIGLEATMLQLPNQQYSDFYTDPAVRAQADVFTDDYFISKNDPVGFYKNGASDASVNWVLRDPAYDALVTRARGTLDDAERSDIAVDLARRWAEAMPWIPAVQSPTTVVLTGGATGVPASGAYRYYPWAADLGTAAP